MSSGSAVLRANSVPGMDAQKEQSKEERKSPMERANIFSLLFFRWMNETLSLGSERPLQSKDLFPLQQEFKTETLVGKLELLLNEGKNNCAPKNTPPRLWKLMFKMFSYRDYLILGAVKLTHSLSNVLLPLMVWYFLAGQSENSNVNHGSVIGHVVGICVLAMVKGISQHHAFFLGGIYGMQLRASVIGMIYKRILTMNRRSMNEAVTGQIINLVSNDANHLREAGWSMVLLLAAPIEIISSGLLVWYLVGWQAFIGAGFFLAVITYISLLSKEAGKLREKAALVTDRRLEAMNEVIAGIRSVKMRVWERNFMDMVKDLRKKEISYIRWRGVILSSFDALYFTNTPIAACISITTLLFTDNYLTAFQIFTLLSTLNVIKFSVSVSMGETLPLLADAKVSLDRIQNFLELFVNSQTDYSLDSVDAGNGSPTFSKIFTVYEDSTFDETCAKKNDVLISPCISLKNIFCSWNEADGLSKTLQNISLEIYRKQLVVITGPVGCGKSSLLLAILGELPCKSGVITHSGVITYVPQLPWIFSGTIQENITFGKPFDGVNYERIIKACCLKKDFCEFSKGDLTHIGQRGVSLSGGQRARICLARALYTDADIFLLDDPLNAVDAKVAANLYKNCIRGLLFEKCCLLVTHQHQFLKNADDILVMKQGAIVHQGKYEELQARDILSNFSLLNKENKRNHPLDSQTSHRLFRRRTNTSMVSPENVPVDLEEGKEERMIGSVNWCLYWRYFRSAYPATMLVCLAGLVLTVQVALISPYWWLSQVANMTLNQQRAPETLGIFGSLVIGALLLSTLVSFLFYHTLLRASEKLHNKMVTAVLKAPVIFFDTNPAGRILNRFSKDIGCMDDTLPQQFLLAVQLCLFTFGATALSAVTNYWLVIGITPLMILFFYYGRYYLRTSRELKRLEAIKCSPVYSHVAETVHGLEVIKVSGMEERFLQLLFRYQDENSPAIIMVLGCSKWLGVRLEVLCSLLVTLVAAGAVIITQIPAIAGLSLVYTLETLDAAQFGLQQVSETETLMTSVERVMTYTQLTPEPGFTTRAQPPVSWPAKGDLSIKDLSLTYVEGGPRNLKDVTFTIGDGEKIGVSGRTGSGKSSLLAALFRMPEPDGNVIVDGINLQTLNVQAARRIFSVITQDPILFSGSLRRNLDPFDNYTDYELWNALDEVQLKQWVRDQLPGQLQYKLLESGSNLSVGQRQLICLVRVLLENKKIVILDEATANVDFKMDRLIHEMILSKFKDTTVIIIAHRLENIVDCDRIMVLDQGRVVEFDKPSALLNKRESYFSELVKNYNNTINF